ncbi:MAG: hypothetical protein AAF488_07905 [Planctomycetota bacterium]
MRRIQSLLLCVLACAAAHSAPPTVYDTKFFESPVRGFDDDLLFIGGDGFSTTTAPEVRVGRTTDPIGICQGSSFTCNVNQDCVAQGLVTTCDPTLPAATVLQKEPQFLTIRIPSVYSQDTTTPTRVLWIRNAGDADWAGPIRINDPRPLWFAPTKVHSDTNSQKLTIVGRNLQRIEEVHLVGSTNYFVSPTGAPTSCTTATADALMDEKVSIAIDLPATMVAGDYDVRVKRICESWIDLPDQILTVTAASALTRIDVSVNGCPASTSDRTACLQTLLNTATAGDEIYFPAGTWVLDNTSSDPEDGLTVPEGVHLTGAGAASTIIQVKEWGSLTVFTLLGDNVISGIHFDDEAIPAQIEEEYCAKCAAGEGPDICNGSTLELPAEDIFLIPNTNQRTCATSVCTGTSVGCSTDADCRGGRTCDDIACDSDADCPVAADVCGAGCGDGAFFNLASLPQSMLRLGRRVADTGAKFGDVPVDDVTVRDSAFSNSLFPIYDGGFRVQRLHIVDNEFRGIRDALRLIGAQDHQLDAQRVLDDRDPSCPTSFNPETEPLPDCDTLSALFDVEDTLIVGNTFHDSGFSSIGDPTNRAGVLAGSLGGAHRVLIADNLIDGRGTTDGDGFRGGFFMNSRSTQEMVLLQNNDFYQPGRKLGDGEAFSVDRVDQRALLENPESVDMGGASQITLSAIAGGNVVDFEALLNGVYRDHWVQIVDGTGLGQARPIDNYTLTYSGTCHIGGDTCSESSPCLPAKDCDASTVGLVIDLDAPFQVAPDTTSEVTVLRQAWNVYMEGNLLDAEQSGGCDRGLEPFDAEDPDSLDRIRTGVLQIGMSSDSLIANNEVICGEGIRTSTIYLDGFPDEQRYNFNLSIFGNSLDRDPGTAFLNSEEFDCDSQTLRSADGVRGGIASFFNADKVDGPTLSYGLSIFDNVVTDASGTRINSTQDCVAGGIDSMPPRSGGITIYRRTTLTDDPDLVLGTQIWGNEVGFPTSFPTSNPSGVAPEDQRRLISVQATCDGTTVLDPYLGVTTCDNTNSVTSGLGSTATCGVEAASGVDCASDCAQVFSCP